MTLPRLALLLGLSALPATAATPPAPDMAGCAPEALQQSFNRGYVQGVEDIQAQLSRATLQMQDQVQRQLNDQLAQMARARDADLAAQMRAAQAQALRDAATAPMPPALTGGAAPAAPTMPGPASPAARAPAAADGLPSDPAQLAPGSVLTIRNAEALPPDLYAALLAYLGG